MRVISTLFLLAVSLLGTTDDLGTITVGGTQEERYIRDEGFFEGAAAQKSLSVKESLNVPGAGGDPIKGIGSLAGVVSINDASGALIIHGARPRESRVVYNQLPVGFLYHWGGLFSTVPPEAIEQIDVYLGGFDASYGNALGAVIDLTPRYPIGSNSGFVHGGLYNASFGYDFKISDSVSGFAAARRSYVDLIVDPESFSQDKTTVFQVPRFWDTTAIVSGYRGDHLLSFELFAGLDELEVDTQDMAERDPAATGRIKLANGYTTLGTRWIYDAGTGYTANTLLYYTKIRIDTGFYDNQIDFLNHATGVVHKSTLKYGQNRRLQWGFEAVNNRLPIQYDGVMFGQSEGQGDSLGGLEPVKMDRTLNSNHYGLFAQEIVPLSPRWSVRYGLRADYLMDDWHPAPRASLVWRPNDQDSLALSTGRYTQSPEGFRATRELGSEKLTAEKADHLVFSYTRRLDTHTSLSIEPYVKRFFDLAVYDPAERYKSTGKGESTGVDVTYKRLFDGD